MSIQYPIKKSLGADVQSFPKTQQEKIVEIIDAINAITTDGLVVESGSQTGSNTPTINQPSGTITTAVLTTLALNQASIVLANSFITASSKVFITPQGYGGTGTPLFSSVACSAGSVTIKFYNAHATVALNAALTFDFLVVN